MKKTKLLCLHGYTQNSSVFSQRLGSWRKALKSRVEFVFADGAFESQGLPGQDVQDAQGTETGGRSWWMWKDSGPYARPSLAATYTGWEASREALIEEIKKHRPHGILGFSQGATAGALLLADLALPEVQEQLGECAPRFAILIAGFLPRDAVYADHLQKAPLNTPTLFVWGTQDTLVTPERSAELRACFTKEAVACLEHSGAHMVPTCSGEVKQAVVNFLGKNHNFQGDS